MNNNSPLVSVAISSFNHEKFVKLTIDSIFNQTYKNIEVFVIDDGSSDNTPHILKELSLKYNFYLELQENKGVVNTFNRLYTMCRGKYIMPCASDDIYFPDRIEKQVLFLEKNPSISVCYSNHFLINDTGKRLKVKTNLKKNIYSFNDLYVRNKSTAMPFIRTSILNEPYYDKNFKIEDWYYLLKITQRGEMVGVIEDYLGEYRIHENNSSKKLNFMFEEKLKLVKYFRPKSNFLYFRSLFNVYTHFWFHKIYSLMPFDLGFKRK